MNAIDRNARGVAAVLLAGAALAACGTMTPGALPLGSSIAEARQSPIGPTAEHALADGGTRLEFRQGKQTYMLDYDAAGHLVTSRQVLTPEIFATSRRE